MIVEEPKITIEEPKITFEEPNITIEVPETIIEENDTFNNTKPLEGKDTTNVRTNMERKVSISGKRNLKRGAINLDIAPEDRKSIVSFKQLSEEKIDNNKRKTIINKQNRKTVKQNLSLEEKNKRKNN